MSRSYKRPFMSITGAGARFDKQMAARGMRRKQNMWLHCHWTDEDLGLIPHRFECCHNEVYDWDRDGKQPYMGLSDNDWRRHTEAIQGIGLWAGDPEYTNWPPLWYRRMVCK